MTEETRGRKPVKYKRITVTASIREDDLFTLFGGDKKIAQAYLKECVEELKSQYAVK